ncbi:hypothetical protein LguiB_021757 [Lonicera macranthoides]
MDQTLTVVDSLGCRVENQKRHWGDGQVQPGSMVTHSYKQLRGPKKKVEVELWRHISLRVSHS